MLFIASIRPWKTDIIETVCYLNIVLFSVAKMVILKTSIEMIYHNIATSISGMITVLLLAYVIARQFCLRFVSSAGKKCKQRLRSKMIDDGIATSNNVYITNANGQSEDPHNQHKSTTSVIEGHPSLCEQSTSNKINDEFYADIEIDDDDNDDSSSVSADSATPLLRREI